MGEQLQAYEDALANHKPAQWILGGLAAITLVSGIDVAAQSTDRPANNQHGLAIANARLMSDEQRAVAAAHAAYLRHARHEAKIARVRASVPDAAITAVMANTHGNVVAANKQLLAHHLPPLTLAQAERTTRQLRFRFTPHDRTVVVQEADIWDVRTPDSDLIPVTKPAAVMAQVIGELSKPDVAALRAGIVAEARSYLGLHEAHGSCNCGPEINQFTLNHHEEWCADWYTYVYMKRGLPFTGGEAWGRESWQIGRVLINPRSPQIPSLQSWFKENGDYFQANDHLPQPGDAILEQWPGGSHVMMVAEVLSGDRLLAIGGNMDNAVQEKVISAHDPLIAGFGSMFKN